MLCSLGFLTTLSCGRVGFASQVRVDPDAVAVDSLDSSPACVWGPFGTPVNATWLNTPLDEFDPTTTVDGLTVFFTTDNGGNLDIASSTSNGVTWRSPQAELATNLTEANASISTDGLTLYWGLYELSRAKRTAVGMPWSASEIFFRGGGNAVTPRGPDISVDDLTLYFSAFNAMDIVNIFTLTRSTPTAAFGNPQPVPGLPTTMDVAFPAISADELELFFEASGGGPSGAKDIYVARRRSRAEPFGPAQKVVEVNSASDEADAEISTDGTTLWFASLRPGGVGSWDIYYAVRACL